MDEQYKLSRSSIDGSKGRIEDRRFVIPQSRRAALTELCKEFQWDGDSLIASGEEIPSKLESIPKSLLLEKTPRARAIVVETAPVCLAISITTPDSLALRPTWTDKHGTPHVLALATLKSGRTIRDGATFYQIKPWPANAVDGISDDGLLRHRGEIETVKSFAETSLSRLKSVASVELSDSAARLLESSVKPLAAKVTPSADFAAGELSLKFQQSDHLSGNDSLIAPDKLKTPWLDGDHFVKLNEAGATLLHRLEAESPTEADGKLIFRGGAVPSALEILRGNPATYQSPSAAAVQLHPTPMEQRTYIDLDEVGSLIVENNLQTDDDRTILQPELPAGDPPNWIRVQNEYFRSPKRLAQPPKAGRKLSKGKFKLDDDAIADFLAQDLPELRHNSKVQITPKAAELRVVTAEPNVRTSIDLEEEGKLVVRPSYRSGNADIPHAELRRGNRDRKYYRRGNTFHRADWNAVRNVEKAVQSAHLAERSDGSFVGAALNFQEIINTFSRLGILHQTEVVRRYLERLANFSGIERVALPAALKSETQDS